MPSLLMHVQYLKGIGHLQRAGLIARFAAEAGFDVHVASGGLPVAGFSPRGARLHQLLPLQAGPGGFRDLRDDKGAPVDSVWMARRRARLMEVFERVVPDFLLIETYPFGRRQLRDEYLMLLDAAAARQPRPAIVCSIRDILQGEERPERLDETVLRLRSYFDRVFVHGDPAFAPLEDSFARAGEIADLVSYTGFVAAPETAYLPKQDTPKGEVLVSAGGGAVGPALFDAAIDARPKTRLADAHWRLITGPHMPEAEFARLARKAGPGLTVERFRGDFRALLGAARLSISYAGYNTSLDVLRTRVPAVLVAYSGDGGETEQAQRAGRLETLGLAATLADNALSGDALAAAIASALSLAPRDAPAIDLDGARNTVFTMLDMAESEMP